MKKRAEVRSTLSENSMLFIGSDLFAKTVVSQEVWLTHLRT